MSSETITIALAGNPNSGKTTVFNAITGSRQHTGNYPGVTVERKEGTAEREGVTLHVVDLPGTYSLTAYSLEEIVARRFVLDDRPDVVVDILDSSNLERNLYLATQFMELGVPLVLAFNMSDLADARGFHIDVDRLAALLGVPIVRTVGHRGKGIDELLAQAVRTARDGPAAVERQRLPRYGTEIEPHLRQLADRLAGECPAMHRPRCAALKLLEGDELAAERLELLCPQAAEGLLAEADRLRQHVEGVCGDSAEIILADRRYGFISGACTECVTRTVERRHEQSDRIDAVITHRFLGLPIFALLMLGVFQLTFALGNPLVDLLDRGKVLLADHARSLGGGGLAQSLLADGVIEGAGAVLSFVPLIALLYLAIAFLEDSGYMARAAFVVDHLMHHIGLHGKSFIPMLIGFGCTVPAILATRILDSRRDRLTTILILPLMSCGARLPIYVLMLDAFFPRTVAFGLVRTGVAPDGSPTYLIAVTNQALILFAIYLTGIVLAAIAAKVFRSTIFRGESFSFVMELPPYRMPTLRGLAVHTAERTWVYVRKVGTIILAIVVVLWVLKTFPRLDEGAARTFASRRQAALAAPHPPIGPADERQRHVRQALRAIDNAEHQARLEHSVVGRIGRSIAPVLRPCGFDWKISTALIGAFAAKEVFIGQMGVIYAVGETDEHSATLRQRLQANYSPLVGLCAMVFILIASPCMGTVAATFREAGGLKWAALQWTYLTVLAWALTTIIYQVGTALRLGTGPL